MIREGFVSLEPTSDGVNDGQPFSFVQENSLPSTFWGKVQRIRQAFRYSKAASRPRAYFKEEGAYYFPANSHMPS